MDEQVKTSGAQMHVQWVVAVAELVMVAVIVDLQSHHTRPQKPVCVCVCCFVVLFASKDIAFVVNIRKKHALALYT